MSKLFLVFGLFLLCSAASFAQDYVNDKDGKEDKDAEVRLRKQLIVNDLENQLKAIQYAAVRVCTGYRLAAWLWKEGKDDTGRAEGIAAAALDDHYKNKAEIPDEYSCDSQLFVLLDKNAKELARQLRAKESNSVDESHLIPFLLREKGGEKLAVDAAIRLLTRRNERNPDLVYLMMRLEQQASPELNRLFSAILAAEQAGRTSFPNYMIEIFSNSFIKPNVPVEIQRQFLGLIVARSRNVAALSDADQWTYYRVLQKLLPEISAIYPELVGEAGAAHAILSTKVDRSTREANEMYDRIKNSSDKLAATVAEAERAEDKTKKYSLYRSSARLALTEKRFEYAVDLMEKASEFRLYAGLSSEDFARQMEDDFYRDVLTKALEANEPNAANYALKKMNIVFSKADGLTRISKYFLDGGNLDSARNAHDEAIKLIGKTEHSVREISTLIRMLPNAQKIEAGRVLEVNQMIAKSINALPTLNVEDKPGTENYNEYVSSIMVINSYLLSAMTGLVKENRNAAADLASRIDRRETKIIADFVLLTDSLTQGIDQNKAEEQPPLEK